MSKKVSKAFKAFKEWWDKTKKLNADVYQKGVIMLKTRAECIKEYGSDYYINQLVDEGKLFRIEKGIFSEKEYIPELVILSYKYPKAVITMEYKGYDIQIFDRERMLVELVRYKSNVESYRN